VRIYTTTHVILQHWMNIK